MVRLFEIRRRIRKAKGNQRTLAQQTACTSIRDYKERCAMWHGSCEMSSDSLVTKEAAVSRTP